MSSKAGNQKAELDQARRAMQGADAKLRRAIDAANSETAALIADLHKRVETEQATALAASAKLEELGSDMDRIIADEKRSASAGIDEAMRHAGAEKAAANEARERESQLRAEVEELRLMVGAEKLAAQAARAELDGIHVKMNAAIEAERQASAQARSALDDIQSTLARTFGSDAGIVAALGNQAVLPLLADSAAAEAGVEGSMGRQEATGAHPLANESHRVNVEPGETFELFPGSSTPNHDHGTSDKLLHKSNNTDLDWDGLDEAADSEDQENGEISLAVSIDPTSTGTLSEEAGNGTAQPSDDDEITAELTNAADMESQPDALFKHPPEDIDALQEIDGIGQAMEQALNACGCYQFRQLANFSPADFEWLGKEIASFPDHVELDRWIEQAGELHAEKYGRDQGKDVSGEIQGTAATNN
ncbi:MAG: hypothetical protein ACR2Q4_11400 [Geminicoccaceae bacterium]